MLNGTQYAEIIKGCEGLELADSIAGDGHKLLNVVCLIPTIVILATNEKALRLWFHLFLLCRHSTVCFPESRCGVSRRNQDWLNDSFAPPHRDRELSPFP